MALELPIKVTDEDVYEYRRSKELQQAARRKAIRAADSSVKRSVRTEIGFVDLYFYYPAERTSDAVAFNFHGGGFCLGYWELDAPYCRLLADLSGAVVVNVDYPVAPEYRYPLSHTIAYDAILWCQEHADELGIATGHFVAIGSSAGGNLAAGMVQLGQTGGLDGSRGTVAFTGFAMNYPVLRMALERDALDPAKAISNTRSLQYLFWEYESLEQTQEPLASPVNAGPDIIWPDLLVNVAGYDSLRGEAEDFRDKLTAAGTYVDYRCYPEAQHGFTHSDLVEYREDDAMDAWRRIARFVATHEQRIA